MRLGENKVSHEYETPKGKVWTIKDKFEGFNQKKKKRLSVERKWVERGKKGWEKKSVWEKWGKYLTHVYFSDIPMILLLYKEAYFNTDELDSCVPSVCVSLLQ